MATDKDNNHTLDSEGWKMERAKTMSESIDELGFILGLHEDDNWKTFRRHPMLSDQARLQFLTDIVTNNIENILYHEPKLMQYYQSLSKMKGVLR
jgi:hypothetical protein